MVNELELYDRQRKLELYIPRSATIIGLGGIGSWLALDLALVGVKKLILVDPDRVELNNLNRTPFVLAAAEIGARKVSAIAEEILVRRKGLVEVLPIPKHTSELNEFEIKKIRSTDLIIDTRDNVEELPFKVHVKLGYDGKNVTIFVNPDYSVIRGEGDGYTVIPSYLVPPQLLSAILTEMITSKRLLRFLKEEKSVLIRFNVEEVVDFVISNKGVIV